jgi:hypothetical protein
VGLVDKKEAKKDFAFKLHHPTNKAWNALLISADTEQEMNDWMKTISRGLDLGLLFCHFHSFFIYKRILIAVVGSTTVFGVDLTIAVRKANRPLPIVFEKCVVYLYSGTLIL